ELKKLRFSLGVTRMDRIRNEFNKRTTHVRHFGDKMREARLRLFGHVQRRDIGYVGSRMLRRELQGRRKRGRPWRRFMKVCDEARHVSNWFERGSCRGQSRMETEIHCGNP
ncbi:hypothetical protein C0J50_21022, partial [Silurus asotus]